MKKIYFLFLFTLGFSSCYFGSVGNKLEENSIILNNLLKLVRETPTTLKVFSHFYDDQGDENLSQFIVKSGNPSVNYTIEVHPTSFVELEKLEFRFNPPEKILGIFSTQTKTHTPYTVPLNLPSTDLYGKTYTLLGKKISNFTVNNSSGIGQGSVFQEELGVLEGVPQGVISETKVFMKRLDIKVNVTHQDGVQKRTLLISFRDYVWQAFPRCKIELKLSQTTNWLFALKYSSIFKDYFLSGSLISPIQQVFSTSSNNETINITDLDTRYELFFKNLQLPDNVFLQESCF